MELLAASIRRKGRRRWLGTPNAPCLTNGRAPLPFGWWFPGPQAGVERHLGRPKSADGSFLGLDRADRRHWEQREKEKIANGSSFTEKENKYSLPANSKSRWA